MNKPIWYSSSKGNPLETFVAFSAGRDVRSIPQADSILVPYDVWTNQAHAIGLYLLGLYNKDELRRVLHGLERLVERWEQGEWRLDAALEDVHINIESFITEQCGESIGGRLHSGRSRNDQVACDMKLYARDVLLSFMEESAVLLEALFESAEKHCDTVMPGYTHHRKATITSWGHWLASYAQGLLRDMEGLISIYNRYNSCPLGAAASYGTPWPLERKQVAELLAFDEVQVNTLDAIVSRGEMEGEIVHWLAVWLKRLSIISQDLILFSTDEFNYLSLPAAFTTGSSIMPQKRNPDFAEALKGKCHTLFGLVSGLHSMNAGNFSGYNKDVQWSKYLFLDAVREAEGSGVIFAEVIRSIRVHKKRMEEATRSGFLNAVDLADQLARTRNLPFRATYRILSEAVGQSSENYFTLEIINRILEKDMIEPLTQEEFAELQDPFLCLTSRDHSGSPHPQQVKTHIQAMVRENEAHKQWINMIRERIKHAKAQSRNPRL